MDVSLRSFSLCCDLLSRVCHTAVTYCKDALENHLHVIVGTLIPLVDDQMEVQEQIPFLTMMSLRICVLLSRKLNTVKDPSHFWRK